MDKRYVVERQGKPFVLYAGLLDEAHAKGLRSIKTHLIQVPTEENQHTAICFAEVVVGERLFTGLGDANETNVARLIVPHLIRMAETRAKARALRDAINVGMVALEELGETEEQTAQKPVAVVRPSAYKPGATYSERKGEAR